MPREFLFDALFPTSGPIFVPMRGPEEQNGTVFVPRSPLREEFLNPEFTLLERKMLSWVPASPPLSEVGRAVGEKEGEQ